MEAIPKQPAGMRAFTIVWIGQVISLLGTGMTSFALIVWAWQKTGSATALALMTFFYFGPPVLLSPIAGALVDRWNRKLVMMLLMGLGRSLYVWATAAFSAALLLPIINGSNQAIWQAKRELGATKGQ